MSRGIREGTSKRSSNPTSPRCRGGPGFDPTGISQSTIVWKFSRVLWKDGYCTGLTGLWTLSPRQSRQKQRPVGVISQDCTAPRGVRRPLDREECWPQADHMSPQCQQWTWGLSVLIDLSPYFSPVTFIYAQNCHFGTAEFAQKRKSHFKHMFRSVGQTEFNYTANNEEQINYIERGEKKLFFAYLTNLSTFAPPIQHYLHFL